MPQCASPHLHDVHEVSTATEIGTNAACRSYLVQAPHKFYPLALHRNRPWSSGGQQRTKTTRRPFKPRDKIKPSRLHLKNHSCLTTTFQSECPGPIRRILAKRSSWALIHCSMMILLLVAVRCGSMVPSLHDPWFIMRL